MCRSPADIHNVQGPATEEDRSRALSLLDQALADYQRLGMPLYVNDAVARRDLLKA